MNREEMEQLARAVLDGSAQDDDVKRLAKETIALLAQLDGISEELRIERDMRIRFGFIIEQRAMAQKWNHS